MLRHWASRLRHFWARRRAAGVPIVYHSGYRKNVWGVSLDPLRGEKILVALSAQGLLRRPGVSEPRPASVENLLRIHTPRYVQSLQEGETLTRILGVEAPPAEREAIVDLQRLMVGGTIQATRLALQGGAVAVHLGGGFHHAAAEGGAGFCVFNDAAVAIARLRARGYAEPILVVDLDLHDGNGTRAIFARDPSVHTFSIHNAHWGDTDAVESTSIALGPGVRDARYLAVLREALPPVFASLRPGLVLYLAGTDPSEDDALGNWRLSASGIQERDRFVTELARDPGRPLPLVVLLAGGYGHLAWRHSARFLLWLACGRALEPLGEEDLILHRARGLAGPRAAAASTDGFDFALSQEELPGLSRGLPERPRFLASLTRQTVELHLERLGILGQLRAKGFWRLRVDLGAESGLGDTLRVFCEDGPDELLVELRVRRSAQPLPGMELLVIEWLLLQDPRAAFSDRRPRLPGQQYPGLGLLKDILGWLVVVCETDGLDGLYFTAAHYHVAMQGRQRVRFLRPEDAALASTLAASLEGLSLAEAAHVLASKQAVRDRAGRAVTWEPAPMVLPVSARLAALVSGPSYEERMAAAAERLRPLRLLDVGSPPYSANA